MKRVYNQNYMLEVLKSGKKVFPKSEMYKACMLLVKARKFQLLETWKLMIKNCENEQDFMTKNYLDNTLMMEK
jgi:hypothetical protein